MTPPVAHCPINNVWPSNSPLETVGKFASTAAQWHAIGRATPSEQVSAPHCTAAADEALLTDDSTFTHNVNCRESLFQHRTVNQSKQGRDEEANLCEETVPTATHLSECDP